MSTLTAPTRAFHGTPNIDAVLSEGLRADRADNSPCVWMALRIEDAAPFGRYGGVVAIDLSQLDGSWPLDESGEPEWQAHYAADIPPSALELVNV